LNRVKLLQSWELDEDAENFLSEELKKI
jgi:hypothetical protein